MVTDTPTIIHNKTYDVTDMFLVCSSGNYFQECKIQNDIIQFEKVINFENICYTFKYKESKKLMSRELLKTKSGPIYFFQLIHNPKQMFEYKLYITSEYNVPNGDSFNFYGILGNLI